MIKSFTGVYLVAGAFLALAVGAAQKRAPETPQEKQLSDSLRGPEQFKASCGACHGKAGKEGRPLAAALRIAPADPARTAARNGGTFPYLQNQNTISGEQQAPA